MALQITVNGTTYTPTVVTKASTNRTPQNVVNGIINRANPDVVLRPAMLDTGVLEVVYAGTGAETASKNLTDAIAGAYIGQLTVTAPDPTSLAMYFVVAGGDIERELEDETRAAWIVRIPFQEVTLS